MAQNGPKVVKKGSKSGPKWPILDHFGVILDPLFERSWPKGSNPGGKNGDFGPEGSKGVKKGVQNDPKMTHFGSKMGQKRGQK